MADTPAKTTRATRIKKSPKAVEPVKVEKPAKSDKPAKPDKPTKDLQTFMENVNKKDHPHGRKIRFAFTKRKRKN